MRSIDCNGVKLTVIGLWTCGKLWSDESHFKVWQSDEGVWVWRMLGERFFSADNKFDGGSIRVWGCFSWFGLGPLVPVIGNMNSEMYVDIFSTMLHSQLYGNISGKAHFSSSRITAPFTPRGLHRRGLMKWVFKNWTGLLKAPI
ncbi:QLQ domain-containing protein [Trichonephila clavipes]|nr:QLQ domain-containing protein [Trichonephila clavipes]